MFSKREIIVGILAAFAGMSLAWACRLEGATMNENVGRHTHLFKSVDFKSHSGLELKWKIECDALSDPEWFTISQMIMEITSPFKEAIGIPTTSLNGGEYSIIIFLIVNHSESDSASISIFQDKSNPE